MHHRPTGTDASHAPPTKPEMRRRGTASQPTQRSAPARPNPLDETTPKGMTVHSERITTSNASIHTTQRRHLAPVRRTLRTLAVLTLGCMALLGPVTAQAQQLLNATLRRGASHAGNHGEEDEAMSLMTPVRW